MYARVMRHPLRDPAAPQADARFGDFWLQFPAQECDPKPKGKDLSDPTSALHERPHIHSVRHLVAADNIALMPNYTCLIAQTLPLIQG